MLCYAYIFLYSVPVKMYPCFFNSVQFLSGKLDCMKKMLINHYMSRYLICYQLQGNLFLILKYFIFFQKDDHYLVSTKLLTCVLFDSTSVNFCLFKLISQVPKIIFLFLCASRSDKLYSICD